MISSNFASVALPTAPSRLLDIEHEADLTRVRFNEPLLTDEDDIAGISRRLTRLAEIPDRRNFLLDLGNVTLVGSAMLATLVCFWRKVRAKDGTVAFCGIHGELRRVFERT